MQFTDELQGRSVFFFLFHRSLLLCLSFNRTSFLFSLQFFNCDFLQMAQCKCCEESYGRQSTLYNIDKALASEKIFVLRDGGGKIATLFTYKGNNFRELCFHSYVSFLVCGEREALLICFTNLGASNSTKLNQILYKMYRTVIFSFILTSVVMALPANCVFTSFYTRGISQSQF